MGRGCRDSHELFRSLQCFQEAKRQQQAAKDHHHRVRLGATNDVGVLEVASLSAGMRIANQRHQSGAAHG